MTSHDQIHNEHDTAKTSVGEEEPHIVRDLTEHLEAFHYTADHCFRLGKPDWAEKLYGLAIGEAKERKRWREVFFAEMARIRVAARTGGVERAKVWLELVRETTQGQEQSGWLELIEIEIELCRRRDPETAILRLERLREGLGDPAERLVHSLLLAEAHGLQGAAGLQEAAVTAAEKIRTEANLGKVTLFAEPRPPHLEPMLDADDGSEGAPRIN